MADETERTNGSPEILIPHVVGPERADSLVTELEPHLPTGTLRVSATEEESLAALETADGMLTGRLTDELLDAARGLRWIQALSAGVDHYDLDRLEEQGIALTNASGVHAEPIAEHVLCFVLMFERGFHHGVRQQSRGVWESFEGGELRGKTVGVIGLGAIGTRVAEHCGGLGMDVIGTKRDLSDVPDAIDEAFSADDHHEVLRRADYVVIACPLTEETRGLIGAEELRLMASDAVLVNIGRGEIVEEDVLERALQNRWIRGAGLDVFATEPLPRESPLWDLSNVVITPHMAGSTPHKLERWREIILENYEALATDDPEAMRNRVV